MSTPQAIAIDATQSRDSFEGRKLARFKSFINYELYLVYTSASETLKSHRAGRDNQGNFEDIKSVTGDDGGGRTTRINNVNVSFLEPCVRREGEACFARKQNRMATETDSE